MLEFQLHGTPQRTGYLEVQVVGGKLLHSKKNGMGYVDSQEKILNIIKGIEAALAEASSAAE